MIHSVLGSCLRRFCDFTWHYPATDVKTTASIQILLIQHLVAQIQASTHFYRDESAFDSYFSQFAQIVPLARAVMEADQAEVSSMKLAPCFILDIGMVQPLFFVACKCRDRCLRRRAIEVMEKVRRGRVQDVQLLARVAMWIISTEEDGLD
jgi:hypothetical protein